MLDVALLNKMVDWAVSEDLKEQMGLDSEWDQDHWIIPNGTADWNGSYDTDRLLSCGTKACVCGRLALERGAEIRLYPLMSFDGLHPSEYGARELGITEGEAALLFASYNTAEDLIQIRDEIIENHNG